MPEHPQFTPQSIALYTESLRRALYDAVVRLMWTPVGNDSAPAYTPDQCGLTVAYAYGRSLAMWTELSEHPDAPPDRRMQLVRVQADPDSPFGIVFQEI